VQLAVGCLEARGQTRVVRRGLCELRNKARHFRVRTRFNVAQRALMLGAQQIPFAALLLDSRGDASLFGKRLRQLQSRFGQRLAPLLDVERRVFAGAGQRLLQRVDGRFTIGGDALAGPLVFRNQSLQSLLFGGRGLKAQRERLPLLFLIARNGNGTGSRCVGSRERALQHRDVAAVLTFALQQHQAALLELLLELDDSGLSASAICRLRFERVDKSPTLGLVLAGAHRGLEPVSDGRVDLIAGSPTFFILERVDRGALGRGVELLRRRLVAEVQQQRLDTVRVVRERHRLKQHRARIVIAGYEMPLDRCLAIRRASRHELGPLAAFGRDQSIEKVAVDDGGLLAGTEQIERGIVAREHNTVEAHP
jgi:hypothetical protein